MVDMMDQQPGTCYVVYSREGVQVKTKEAEQSLMNAWRKVIDEEFVTSEPSRRVIMQFPGRSWIVQRSCPDLVSSRARLS